MMHRNRSVRKNMAAAPETVSVSSLANVSTLRQPFHGKMIDGGFLVTTPTAIAALPIAPRSVDFEVVGATGYVIADVTRNAKSVFQSRPLAVGSNVTKYKLRLPRSVERESATWVVSFQADGTMANIQSVVGTVNWAVQY
jgi:hypothetical protein